MIKQKPDNKEHMVRMEILGDYATLLSTSTSFFPPKNEDYNCQKQCLLDNGFSNWEITQSLLEVRVKSNDYLDYNTNKSMSNGKLFNP